MDAPDFCDALLDLVFQRQHFGSGGVATVDNGKGVLAGDTHPAAGIALAEAGMLDQPCG